MKESRFFTRSSFPSMLFQRWVPVSKARVHWKNTATRTRVSATFILRFRRDVYSFPAEIPCELQRRLFICHACRTPDTALYYFLTIHVANIHSPIHVYLSRCPFVILFHSVLWVWMQQILIGIRRRFYRCTVIITYSTFEWCTVMYNTFWVSILCFVRCKALNPGFYHPSWLLYLWCSCGHGMNRRRTSDSPPYIHNPSWFGIHLCWCNT